ncbi:MAG: hypothetical protein OEZ10_01600 [Gammaproteobacteria bacterium]|nr:hypothetical protein [Gammaproteobacteria bacterium]
MAKIINVAIIGLGEAGEIFALHLLEKIQIDQRPVKIVAAVHNNLSSPVALGFQQNGVPVFSDIKQLADLGQGVDIIFNMTGDGVLAQKLRLELLERKNRHTVIASDLVAHLLWSFFDEDTELPEINDEAA